jgi:hypothetical protein
MPFDQTAVWKIAAALLGQTALLTGLLVYFGWVRTQTTYRHFGLDTGLLDLSTTDLVLASVDSAYNPLLLLGFAFFAGTVVHSAAARGRLRGARVRARAALVGWALVGVGALSTLSTWFAHRVGAIVPNNPGLAFAWLPATLAAGFALLAYVSLTGSGRGRATWLSGGGQMTFALVALSVMALFWTVSVLAVRDGRQRARDIEIYDAALSEVAVLSHDDLFINNTPRVVHTGHNAARIPVPASLRRIAPARIRKRQILPASARLATRRRPCLYGARRVRDPRRDHRALTAHCVLAVPGTAYCRQRWPTPTNAAYDERRLAEGVAPPSAGAGCSDVMTPSARPGPVPRAARMAQNVRYSATSRSRTSFSSLGHCFVDYGVEALESWRLHLAAPQCVRDSVARQHAPAHCLPKEEW